MSAFVAFVIFCKVCLFVFSSLCAFAALREIFLSFSRSYLPPSVYHLFDAFGGLLQRNNTLTISSEWLSVCRYFHNRPLVTVASH
jgi:hypothetical protein